MAKVWDNVHDRVAGGASFAEALNAHRKIFPQLVIQLTRAGEASGNLELVLSQAADQLERKRTLLVTVVSAMLYPTVTTLMAIAVGAYLMVKVIPELATFLNNQGRELPGMTLALIATSDFITKYGIPFAITLIALVVALVVIHQFPPGARAIDRTLLRIPIVGKILRLSATTLFARGLSMLLEAGVPVISALETAGALVKNKAVGARVEQTRQSVLAGQSLAKPLGAGREFLPMLPRMVAVGEETGTLGVVLSKVANFHEKQLESYVKRMTLLIEPVMTIVVGGMVGFVYLAFFMAIYSVVGKGSG
jgi:type IV pilus assembly protein PilC